MARIEFNLAQPLPAQGQRSAETTTPAEPSPLAVPTPARTAPIRKAASAAMEALNRWRDAGDQYGIGSPQEQAARAAFQDAERLRIDERAKVRRVPAPVVERPREHPQGIASRLSASVRRAYEATTATLSGLRERMTPLAERTAKARGFVWERVKGFCTLGVYEYVQGLRLARQTAELGGLIEEDEQRILSHRHIWDMAMAQREARGAAGMNEQERAALDLEILRTFIQPAYRRNQALIDEMVWAGIEVYKDRMKHVKRTMTGESPLSEARLREVEQRLRALLAARADATRINELGAFSRELRRLTDPHWKKRFGFGALETVLGVLGIVLVVKGQAAAAASGAGAAPAAPVPVPPGVEGPARDLFIEMHKNVWTTLKQYAMQHGKALTDQQLMSVVEETLRANHLAEPEWLMDMAGNASTRALPEGFILNCNKLSAAAQAMLGIAP